MEKSITSRGFTLITFTDLYGAECSLQKSSLATEDAVWLGVNDANPQIMASKTLQGGTGWVPYDIGKIVFSTKTKAKEFAPWLLFWYWIRNIVCQIRHHLLPGVRYSCLPKGIPPKGIPPKGIPPKGIPPKGIPPKGIPPKGIPPKGIPPPKPPKG
jgi:hypothetical protein